MNYRIILSFFLLVSFISCKDELTNEKTDFSENGLWIHDDRFIGESGILINSFGSDEKLSIAGINRWMTIDTNNVVDWCTNFSYYLGNSIGKKIPITEDVFAWYLDTILIFNTTKYYIHNYLPEYRLSRFGSDYEKFGHWSINRKNECILISKSLHSLIPLTTKGNYTAYFVVKPKYYKDTIKNFVDFDISTEDTYVKKVDWVPLTDYSKSLYSAFDKFFVTTSSKFYVIDTIGNVKKLLDCPIAQVINKSDSLFAISDYGVVYVSNDKGDNWSQVCQVQPVVSFLNWVLVDNSLIAYQYRGGGQLYSIDFDDNSMMVDTLASGGLKDKEITSLSVFNGKVYATTLSGLYYKELRSFRKK